MKKTTITFILASFVSMTACKPQDQSSYSLNESKQAAASFSCKSESEKDGTKIFESANLIIGGNKVGIDYKFKTEIKNVGFHTGGEKITTEINRVFDFNRVSKDYVYVVTLPSKMEVTTQDKTYQEELGLLIVSINKGELLVKDDNDKTIIMLPNCVANTAIYDASTDLEVEEKSTPL